jgi:hypothetical protein
MMGEVVIIPAEEWREVKEQIADMKSLLEKVADDFSDSKRTIDLSGVAKRQDVSLSQVRKDLWRQPFFGKSEHNTRKKQWERNTYLKWEAELEKHRREWLSMSVAERRKAMERETVDV